MVTIRPWLLHVQEFDGSHQWYLDIWRPRPHKNPFTNSEVNIYELYVLTTCITGWKILCDLVRYPPKGSSALFSTLSLQCWWWWFGIPSWIFTFHNVFCSQSVDSKDDNNSNDDIMRFFKPRTATEAVGEESDILRFFPKVFPPPKKKNQKKTKKNSSTVESTI